MIKAGLKHVDSSKLNCLMYSIMSRSNSLPTSRLITFFVTHVRILNPAEHRKPIQNCYIKEGVVFISLPPIFAMLPTTLENISDNKMHDNI
jgi:hypothetical protein